MTKARHIILSAFLIAVCLTLTVAATALRIGDTVGHVLASDIRAFYNGYEIPTYNIDGYVGVVAEDLIGYGYAVTYDNGTRTLSITRVSDKVSAPVAIPEKSREPNGTPLMPVLHTDIVTTINGQTVESFNIGGKTVIYFDRLAKVAGGSFVYDNGSRLSLISTEERSFAKKTVDMPREIMHAGGALGDYTGTNSLEALNNSHYRGYRFYELDFLLSSDGIPVCLHDWTGSFSAELTKEPISAEAFENIKILGQFTPLTVESLAFWLEMHPDTYIITDVKDDNITALRYIADNYPDIIPRLMPQIYHYDEYAPVRAMGYSNIIFTLYSLPSYEDKISGYNIEFAKNNGIVAVTAGVDLIEANKFLVKKYADAEIPLYVHTVNSTEQKQALYGMGVSGVYTDFHEE